MKISIRYDFEKRVKPEKTIHKLSWYYHDIIMIFENENKESIGESLFSPRVMWGGTGKGELKGGGDDVTRGCEEVR